MRLQWTGGQAIGSVVIATIGKTTDFFATNILVLPLQYVIMRYFSSSVAYINGFQVAWYYGNSFVTQNHYDSETREIQEKDSQFPKSLDKYESDFAATRNTTSMTHLTFVTEHTCNTKLVYVIRVISMCVIFCLLLMCVTGFVLNVESFYGLFAPAAIAFVMLVAYGYLHYKRRKRHAYTLQ